LIDEFKGPINSEIKDDDQAEQVWSLINDLENKLEEVKNENRYKNILEINKKSLL